MRWLILPFLPVLLVVAAFAGVFARKKQRTPEEVARYLREFIDGTGGEWDWDDFESVPIADPVLDRIRERAAAAGPPNADIHQLRLLLEEAEDLVSPDR